MTFVFVVKQSIVTLSLGSQSTLGQAKEKPKQNASLKFHENKRMIKVRDWLDQMKVSKIPGCKFIFL